MNDPIFLHGLFRCGSTYFFDKFRSDQNIHCYYEPFHHVINQLRPDSIDIWAHSGKTSHRMKHPILIKPHFHEYLGAFEENQVKFFDKSLSYDRFYLSDHDTFDLEKNYIDHLIDCCPDGKTVLLQFNRSTFRLPYFTSVYPNSKHIFLLKNPRSQFLSYVLSGQIFLTINLIVASRLSEQGLSLPVVVDVFESENIQKEISYYTYKSIRISIIQHYKIFLYLWCWSYYFALTSNCIVIDTDRATPESLLKDFHDSSFSNIDFTDFKSRKPDPSFLLTAQEAICAESEVFDSFLLSLISDRPYPFNPYNYVAQDIRFDIGLRRSYYKQVLKSLILPGLKRFKRISLSWLKSKIKRFVNAFIRHE